LHYSYFINLNLYSAFNNLTFINSNFIISLNNFNYFNYFNFNYSNFNLKILDFIKLLLWNPFNFNYNNWNYYYLDQHFFIVACFKIVKEHTEKMNFKNCFNLMNINIDLNFDFNYIDFDLEPLFIY
jgi:hypothetical protein